MKSLAEMPQDFFATEFIVSQVHMHDVEAADQGTHHFQTLGEIH